MRSLAILFICLFCYSTQADAIGRRHRYAGEPKTEVELMGRVLECLRNKDTIGYYNLFPPFDSMWKMVIHNPNPSADVQKELAKLKEHPTVLLDLDPYYNKAIMGRFAQTLKKGEDSGVQWKGIISQRFELQKQELQRGMEGLQHVIPERFKGFLFVRDMLSSTTFCITIAEIQKVNGFFCGGQVINVLEASDVDAYIKKERAEAKHLEHLRRIAAGLDIDPAKADSAKKIAIGADSTKSDSSKMAATGDSAKAKKSLILAATSLEEEPTRPRKEVVDRKFYKGKFDEEIPVELYVRYMKDLQGKVTKYWDALYKFGDMQEYVKLDVSKSDEDKWLFEEPVATMELDLIGKVYSGSWLNGENQTGYDAELTQTAISQEKIMKLDKILENGTWGKTDEQEIKEEGDGKKSKKNRKSKSDKDKNSDKDKKDDKDNADKADKKDPDKKEPDASDKPEKKDAPTAEKEKKKDSDPNEAKPKKAPKDEDEE